MTTLEAVREIVSKNPRISKVFPRAYFYIPLKPTMDDEVIRPLSREEFLEGTKLDEFIENQEEGWNVCIESRVELDNGEIWHIPMLDLAPRKSPEALEKVMRQLSEIIVPYFDGGVILETRKSYHFIGTTIFKDNRFDEFLGRALITSIVTHVPGDVPNIHEHITDYRYIGFSLMRHNTGLRVTAKGDKSVIPKVISLI